nr:hypothetical protein [Mycoplasmopsis bovis]
MKPKRRKEETWKPDQKPGGDKNPGGEKNTWRYRSTKIQVEIKTLKQTKNLEGEKNTWRLTKNPEENKTPERK